MAVPLLIVSRHVTRCLLVVKRKKSGTSEVLEIRCWFLSFSCVVVVVVVVAAAVVVESKRRHQKLMVPVDYFRQLVKKQQNNRKIDMDLSVSVRYDVVVVNGVSLSATMLRYLLTRARK